MHLSTHNWMRAEPLETTLARISKLGYESIEISGEPTQYETKATRKALQGLQNPLLGFGDAHPRPSATSPRRTRSSAPPPSTT